MEKTLGAALEREGYSVVRAHQYDAKLSMVSSQVSGKVWRSFVRSIPQRAADRRRSVWQYSHHIFAGLTTHRGPILTVANWSGQCQVCGHVESQRFADQSRCGLFDVLERRLFGRRVPQQTARVAHHGQGYALARSCPTVRFPKGPLEAFENRTNASHAVAHRQGDHGCVR